MRTPTFLHQAARLILRFRILHILFWTANYLSVVHQLRIFQQNDATVWLDAIFPLGANLAAVYLTLYLLLPWLFRKQRYVLFVFATLVNIAVCSIVFALLNELVMGHLLHRQPSPTWIVAVSFTVDSFIKVCIFGSIVIVYNWMRDTLKRRQIAHERIRAELDFLKAQINPHFLLNTINNIYVLIDEDRKIAGEMLIRFSDLLRYQLYDCNESHNPIAMEMEFIHNFIGIEQLRLGGNVKVETSGMDTLPYFEIAPFVLMPFVENAFKYVSRRPDGNNRLSIEATSCEGVFHFTVANTFDELIRSGTLPKPGGIGISNVQRRLELLYPGRHLLELVKAGDTHTVKLSIHV